MTEPYYYWKALAAVEALAKGEGPLRQRILWALRAYAGVLEDELPPPVREVYLELMAHTTWKQDGDPSEGTWANTLAEMSDDDARKVADLIIDVLDQAVRCATTGA